VKEIVRRIGVGVWMDGWIGMGMELMWALFKSSLGEVL